jgi:hypothetical protein
MAEPESLPPTSETPPRPIDTYRGLVADRAGVLRRRRRAVLGSGLGLLLVAAGVIGLSVARAGGSHTTTASGVIVHPGSSSTIAGPSGGTYGNARSGSNSNAGISEAGPQHQGNNDFGTMHGCRPDVLCFVSGPGLAQFTTARPHRFTVPSGTLVVINLTDDPGARWGVPTVSATDRGVLLRRSPSGPGRATLAAKASGTATVTVRCSGSSCPRHSFTIEVQVRHRSSTP